LHEDPPVAVFLYGFRFVLVSAFTVESGIAKDGQPGDPRIEDEHECLLIARRRNLLSASQILFVREPTTSQGLADRSLSSTT
jgi:hypothetical protein